jgi:hypothetical protein
MLERGFVGLCQDLDAFALGSLRWWIGVGISFENIQKYCFFRELYSHSTFKWVLELSIFLQWHMTGNTGHG